MNSKYDGIREIDCPRCGEWHGPNNQLREHLPKWPGGVAATDGGQDGGDEVTTLEPGDRVVDREVDKATIAIVLEATDEPAAECVIPGLGETVAEANPEYPPEAPVVLVAFRDDLDTHLPGWKEDTLAALRGRVDGSRVRTYSYPAPRLKPARADAGGDR
jgi:hypothetical protein